MKKQFTENNHRTFTRDVQLKIDEVFAEKGIPANDSVRLLNQIVEDMDKTPLKRALKRGGRWHLTNPIAMLKGILYASMEHKYSSRSISEACVRDIKYIWLLNSGPTPSYRAICRFRSEVLSECAEAIFYKMVEKHNKIQQNRSGSQLHQKLTA